MKLIIGLGNPGEEYVKTRHNAGFMFVDGLIKKLKLDPLVYEKKFNAGVSKTSINNKKVILAKPQTFMNNSGAAVRALADFYKISPKNVILVHDDKDIPLGEYRSQANRSSAGHKGVESVIERLGTQDFHRFRLGIAPKTKTRVGDTADFVIGKFTPKNLSQLEEAINLSIEELKKMF